MILIIRPRHPADDRIRCLNPQTGPLWKGHRHCSRPCRSGSSIGPHPSRCERRSSVRSRRPAESHVFRRFGRGSFGALIADRRSGRSAACTERISGRSQPGPDQLSLRRHRGSQIRTAHDTPQSVPRCCGRSRIRQGLDGSSGRRIATGPRPDRAHGVEDRDDRILHYVEAEGRDGSIILHRSKKDSANELGLTHEALYRALARMERCGLIRVRDRTLTILSD